MAQIMDIVERKWTRIVEFDCEKSLRCGPARPIAPRLVIEEAGWTLFAFDFKRRLAVFLDVADCDLSQAPFAYTVQFEEARRQALLSFDELLELDAELPDVKNLVQLFNIGHCGSTLLHKVFNHVAGVWCVSEPIAFMNLAMARQSENPALLSDLAGIALKLLAFFPGVADAKCLIVKHFSQSTTQFKLLHDAQPDSKCLFMYRDALSWSNSFYHFVQKHGATLQLEKQKRSFYWGIMSGSEPESYLDGVVDLHGEHLTLDRLAAAAWALHIQQWKGAIQNGVPLFPLRYNELVDHKVESLTTVFAHLGLPTEAVYGTLSAFEFHAHEGTRTARTDNDLDFDATNYACVEEVLTHPKLALNANVILGRGRERS